MKVGVYEALGLHNMILRLEIRNALVEGSMGLTETSL